jgi:DNA-binding LytR/AlgR family response regulator
MTVRALIADDERLLREQLQARLQESWPELAVVGMARDGLEAVQLADALRPDVVFLDIRMPGLTGIEAARDIVDLDGWRGELVFVTAYDEYAVTAFEQGAVDYLLKPVERTRLDVTVARVKSRLQGRRGDAPSDPAPATSNDRSDALMATLEQLQRQMHSQQASGMAPAPKLRWLQCSTGNSVKLIAVDDVLFFRSDEKYTRLQLDGSEALIRTPIRELAMQLDEQRFWQIHRSTIVNLSAIASVQRDESGRQRVQLKNHREVLEVSRSYGNLFRHQ